MARTEDPVVAGATDILRWDLTVALLTSIPTVTQRCCADFFCFCRYLVGRCIDAREGRSVRVGLASLAHRVWRMERAKSVRARQSVVARSTADPRRACIIPRVGGANAKSSCVFCRCRSRGSLAATFDQSHGAPEISPKTGSPATRHSNLSLLSSRLRVVWRALRARMLRVARAARTSTLSIHPSRPPARVNLPNPLERIRLTLKSVPGRNWRCSKTLSTRAPFVSSAKSPISRQMQREPKRSCRRRFAAHLLESVAVYWLMRKSYQDQDYRTALRYGDTLLRTSLASPAADNAYVR